MVGVSLDKFVADANHAAVSKEVTEKEAGLGFVIYIGSQARRISSGFRGGALLGGFALLKQHSRSENGSDDAEGSERDESNHQDGHRSLLIRILGRDKRSGR